MTALSIEDSFDYVNLNGSKLRFQPFKIQGVTLYMLICLD